MQKFNVLAVICVLLTILLTGCSGSRPSEPGANTPDATPVVWLKEKVEVEGMQISVGYQGQSLQPEKEIIPVAIVDRDGKSVPDAMVFCQFVADEKDTPMSDEVATEYTSSQYVASPLKLPEGTPAVLLRFRIDLPDVEQPWSHKLLLKIESPTK